MDLEEARALAYAGTFPDALAASASSDEPQAVWVRAYVACARGEFARAEQLAASLRRAPDRGVRHRANLTLGSVLRQTGRHAEAWAHDREALRAARDPVDRAHALVGLAADEVGRGNAPASSRYLARAAALAPRTDRRLWTRLWWVRAEHALLLGRPRTAIAAAERALHHARTGGLRRHEAKSLLFLGAAMQASGDRRAGRTLARAERLAGMLGARAIERIARQLRRQGAG